MNVRAIEFERYGALIGPALGADGRITFRALIPGALYRLSSRGADARALHKDFTVTSGETLGLGDISIAR